MSKLDWEKSKRKKDAMPDPDLEREFREQEAEGIWLSRLLNADPNSMAVRKGLVKRRMVE